MPPFVEIAGLESRSRLSAKGIQTLLAEVNALANQLRKGGDESDPVRLGGRGILRVLGDDEALTVPEIARIRGTSRQNIQMLVNRLVGAGFVEMTSNPAHRKSALVRITGRGRALLGTIKDEEEESAEKLPADISEAELAAAATTLRRVRKWLAGAEAPCNDARAGGVGPQPTARKAGNRERQEVTARVPFESAGIAAHSAGAGRQGPDEDAFPVNLL